MAKTTITELCNVPLLILAILVRSSPSQSLLGYAAIGTLEIIYSNPENILQNRHVCDLLPHDRACDVYFEICFSSEYGECDIFQYRSKIFKDSSNVRIVGDSAIIMFLKSPLPDQVDVKVTAFDHDAISVHDLIGVFTATNVSIVATSDFVDIPVTPQSNKVSSMRFQMGLNVSCLENYYGDRCQRYCKPDGLSYRCSLNGDRICLEGFFGEYCNHSNVCLREPCAPGAECVAKLAGRICICNGGDHPECYPENDPCAMSPCLNGGECGRSLTNPRGFICSCPKYYTGTFCEQRLSVCALAEEEGSSLMRETFTMTRRNAEQSEGTNNAMPETALCLNGGICVDHPKLFTYFCDCPKEWTGKRCEKRVIEQHDVTLAIGLSCGIFSVILLIGGIVYFCKRRRWKRRVTVLQERNTFIYETPFQQTNQSSGLTANDGIYATNGRDSYYEPIHPLLGDSLSIQRPTSSGSNDKNNPPLPARPSNLPVINISHKEAEPNSSIK